MPGEWAEAGAISCDQSRESAQPQCNPVPGAAPGAPRGGIQTETGSPSAAIERSVASKAALVASICAGVIG